MTKNNGSISLPSFRDGVEFQVKPLNFGGMKAMLKAENDGAAELVSTMMLETLKREYPNVTENELDELEQEDFIKLLKLVTKANEGLSNMDFTVPTNKSPQP